MTVMQILKGGRMKKIKMKVSFVIVEDVEVQEEYFRATDKIESRTTNNNLQERRNNV